MATVNTSVVIADIEGEMRGPDLSRFDRSFLAAILISAISIPAFASGPQPFDVEITLSETAGEEIASRAEGIVVSARYYAEASEAGMPQADDLGQIVLGNEELQLPGEAGTAHLRADGVNRLNPAAITGDVLANINVFSARLSGPDNILACDFFDGRLADLIERPVTLHCSLITEGRETEFKS